MFRLPMLYEVKAIFPDRESLAQSERTVLFKESEFASEPSRTEQIYDRLLEDYPDLVECSMRLMRPREIKELMPFRVRIEELAITAIQRHISILMELDERRKEGGDQQVLAA